MSRPRRSEHNRQALLDEGMRQLAEHGYHGTGIKQILDSVQVPKGSFYNYFESKEAFVAAILDQYTEHHVALFDAFVERSAQPAFQKLRAVQDYMLAQFEQADCQRGCLVGSIAAEIGRSSPLCQTALSRSRAAWQRRVGQLLQQAQNEGEIRREIAAEQLAEMYWATWEGALIRMKLDGNTLATRRIVENTLQLMRATPT